MPRGVFVRSEEHKAKMSLALKGRVSPMKGRHHSAETRAKISYAQSGEKHHVYGKHLSEATRAKLSLAAMGKQNGLGWRPSQEQRAKQSQSQMGRHFSEEHRTKISLGLRGNRNTFGSRHSEEHRIKQSLAAMGKHPLETTKAKLRLGRIGKHHTKEARARMSQSLLLRWQDPEYRDKTVRATMLAAHIHPNKPEIALLALLDSLYPGEWKYTGDGKLIVAGKNPDFWNGDHKLIEMWGDYWHKGEDPEDRIKLFKEHGYSSLIIWESELKEPQAVLKRIIHFSEPMRIK